MMTLALGLSLDRVVVGTFTGLTYGLLAVGLVLVYRSNRFVNFAQGAIGVFGASILSLLVTSVGAPYWVAFPLACGVAAGVGAITEIVVIRRLAGRPRLVGMIATLGLADFIVVLGLLLNPTGATGFTFPIPPGLPSFTVGRTPVGPALVAMLLLTPALLLGLTVFLKRSRQGLAIRAAADAPTTSARDGVKPQRMASMTWAIAGAIGALSAILVTPSQGVQSIETLGPDLLLRGLAGAVVGRMTSLPIAFGASVGVGVLEQVLLANGGDRGIVDVTLAILVLVALLVQPKLYRREDEDGGWRRLGPRPLPTGAEQIWWLRRMGAVAGGVVVALAVGASYLVSNETASIFTLVLGVTLVGMSVAFLAGVAGQLSLGQFALAGIGAAISIRVTAGGGSMVAGIVVGCLTAAVVAMVVGLPAVRLRGLALAVTTLGFALATSSWLLRREVLLGDGRGAPRPEWNGYALTLARDYYLFALLVLLVGWWVVTNLRRSGFGRTLLALRDNEDAARALGVSVVRTRLQAFAVAGGLAGLGGVVIAHGQAQVTVNSFPAGASIEAVAVAVVGGIGLVGGPLLGAITLVGLPALLDLGIAGRAATSLGWLLVVVMLPRGLGGILVDLRDMIATRVIARRSRQGAANPTASGVAATPAKMALAVLGDPDPAAATRAVRAAGVTTPATTVGAATGMPLLHIAGCVRRFGGVTAVDGVDLDVHAGEVVGIIGPNGAGKTTFFEVIAGFTKADAGSVAFQGTDVTAWSADARARAGLVRSFQDARLFRTLTVHEAVSIAAAHVAPAGLVAAGLGATGADRRRAALTDELVGAMGLGDLAHRPVGELSTGTRRVVELTALLALSPTVLLLDEPSAGLSQEEGEQLVRLLHQVRQDLGTTLVVIEHDLALLSRLATRMVAMDHGRIIADGAPDDVRNHPEVIRSYLGGGIPAAAPEPTPVPPIIIGREAFATPSRGSRT